MKMRAVMVATLAWAAAAGTAEAKTRLAVAELAAPQNLAGISDKIAQEIVDVASRDPALVVLRPVEVATALGPDSLKSLQGCGGRPGCVSGHAKAVLADRMVVGSLDRTENSYLVKLFLIDLKAATVISTVDRSILIASRRLQADVAAAIPGLLKGQAEARGKLTITTSKPGAAVVFDGDVAGKTPLTLEAKPGKHTLKVTREGFLAVERFVTVTEGSTETIALTLTAIPGAVVEEDPFQAPKKAPAEASSGTGFSVPVASWVAGGLAVAAAGAGTYFAVTTSQAASKAGEGPVYAITREEALAGRQNALITNVCWGVAGAAAVTAVLLGALLPQPAPEAKAAPQASLAPLPGGAAVSLSGTF